MNKSQIKWWLLAGCLLVAMAPAGYGQVEDPHIDYFGYAWETGGFPPSDLGDELIFTCVATYLTDLFEVNLDDFELTFHLHDMVNCGSTTLPSGTEVISYCDGFLDIYMDAAKDADWGINPPNLTSPSNFTDGILFFHGSFSNFTMFMTSYGYGSFEGTLDGEDGWVINEICSDCAYTWGGAFSQDIAQVPEGYDLQIDGVLEMDYEVPTEDATWGTIKTLFR